MIQLNIQTDSTTTEAKVYKYVSNTK